MTGRGRWHRREQGSFAVEAALIAPVVLSFVMLVVAAGRLQTAGGTVDAAARAAARSASLARTEPAARQAASAAAEDTLVQQGVRCTATNVQLDTGDFAPPAGETGQVTATVRCTVPLDDLMLRGLPGSRTMTGRFTSVVDRYRGR
jgi:Flp pilus assembly protein TadG